MEHGTTYAAGGFVEEQDDGSWSPPRSDWRQGRTVFSRALGHFFLKLGWASLRRSVDHHPIDAPGNVFVRSVVETVPFADVSDAMEPKSKRPSTWLMAGVSCLIVGVPFIVTRTVFDLLNVPMLEARVGTGVALSLGVFWTLYLFGRDHRRGRD